MVTVGKRELFVAENNTWQQRRNLFFEKRDVGPTKIFTAMKDKTVEKCALL